MRLIFFIHFVIFFALGFCSLLGESGKHKSRSKKHSLSLDSAAETVPETKKLRITEVAKLPAALKKIIDDNLEDHFVEYMHNYVFIANPGDFFLDYCVKNDRIKILKTYFEMSARIFDDEVFDALFWTLKLAASLSKLEIIKALAIIEFFDTEEKEFKLLEWILQANELKVLKACLDNGIEFDSWRTRREQTLSHFVVQKNWLAVADSLSVFHCKDKSGLTPIFYAKSVEMVRLIRSKLPGARDDLNKAGRTVWQLALMNNNNDLLDAMISPARRLKKFRAKQLDYYNLQWVKSASLLRINRDNLLQDSISKIYQIRRVWYQPKHKFFIKFVGEYGIDAGGLKVEWITALLNSFFIQNPRGNVADFTAPVFLLVEEEGSLYAPNTAYSTEMFKFVGSILGLAFAMNVPIKQKFIPSIYKLLMHKEIDLVADLQEQSPTTFRSLQYLTGPSVRLSELELRLPSNPFAYVTKRNVQTYIREYSKEVLVGRYQKHISELVRGFESVQTVKITSYFKLEEFKKHLTGKPADYTADEFIRNCICTNEGIKEALRQLIWEMTAMQRVLLLKFVTGFDALPANGFDGWDKQITVMVDERLVGKFPTSSTCSFNLHLPPLVNYEAFAQSLITAIENSQNTDNEPGVQSHSEGIVLEFDFELDEDEYWASMANESESEVEFTLEESEEEEDNVTIAATANTPQSTTDILRNRPRIDRHRVVAFSADY